jgi:cbb3-type cytochrome oxidase cytochrome c subunit
VGPDLSRESGKRTNDWHFAHLYNPKWVEPQSVMPSYAWFFETVKNEKGEETILPKQEAVDLVAYLQWLGHQVAGRSGTTFDPDAVVMPPAE